MFKTLRFAVLIAGVTLGFTALAQPAPDDQAPPPGQGGDQVDPPSRVARLSYIKGAVSFVPAGEQTWGCLENVASPEQIVFGTDWPFANVNVTAEAMKTYEALDAITPAQRSAIDRGNALRLFPQFA